MGRIVAVSGGTLETTELINKYMIEISAKENPNVLFIRTAAKDNAGYVSEFTAAFNKLGAKVETVLLTHRTYQKNELQNMIDRADIIYVGDGNAVFMMNKWKEVSLDEMLYRAFKSDSAVLAGLGAGAACWFSCGYSNSDYNHGHTDRNYIWVDKFLGIHNVAICPHYDKDAVRGFDRRLMDKGIPGFTFEDNSAFVQNGERSMFIKSADGVHAYSMVFLNGLVACKEVGLVCADRLNDENASADDPC